MRATFHEEVRDQLGREICSGHFRSGQLLPPEAELCARFPALDRCTVMQHLKVLEGADLVIVRREGRERWNHLNAEPIKAVHDRWLAPYTRGAVAMLADLKSRVEA